MPDADLSSAAVGDRGMPVTLKPSNGRQGSLVCRLPLPFLLLVSLLSGCWVVVARYRNPTNGPAAAHNEHHPQMPAKVLTFLFATQTIEQFSGSWRGSSAI